MTNRKSMEDIHGLGRRSEPKVPPPHNLGAEAAVLGAVLFDNAVADLVWEHVHPDDFYAPAHQWLATRMKAMIAAGKVADGVTLVEAAETEQFLKELGGGKYLIDLLDASAFGPEVKDYARIIRDLAVRRRLIRMAESFSALAQNPPDDWLPSRLLAEGRRMLDDAESQATGASATLESAADVVAEVLAEMSVALETGKRLPDGISTGSAKLDNLIGRMHPGDLIVLAGRPSMGKTAVGMNIAMNAKTRDDKGFPVPARACVLSLEMDRRQLAYRVSSSAARRNRMGHIAYRRAREGKLGQNEITTLRAAWKKIPTQIVWETRGRLSYEEARAAIKAARRRLGGLDLVVIDYLQIMNLRIERGQTKTDAIGEVTAAFKALAKEMGIAIVLLSQLSRGIEARDDKRPVMSDLRDSGAIEQDADVIIMVYREEYYLDQTRPKKDAPEKKRTEWEAAFSSCKDKVELIASKVRNGSTGTATLHFERETDTVVDEKDELYEEAMV